MLLALAAMAWLLSACTPGSASTRPAGASASPGQAPAVFTLSAIRARQVSTVVRMIDAYNLGRIDEVLSLLDDSVVWTDCDYKAIALVALGGKTQVAPYLKLRFADHDQYEIESVWNQNPGADGALTVGLDYSRRASDSLRALGFSNGIRPSLASKVVFDSTGSRITRFANGPYGGSAETCRAQWIASGAAEGYVWCSGGIVSPKRVITASSPWRTLIEQMNSHSKLPS
jgi:hypothetical protein